MKRVLWLMLVLGVVAALLILNRTQKSGVATVQRSVHIGAPPRVVFALVNDFRNWFAWSVWHDNTEHLEKTYLHHGLGQGGAVMFVDTGTDKREDVYTIVKSAPYNTIELAMDFAGRMFIVSHIRFSEQDNETMLEWSMGFKKKGLGTFLSRYRVKNQIEKSLKALAEVARVWHDQGIQVVEPGEIDSFPYVSIRRQVSYEELSDHMAYYYEQMIRAGDEGRYRIVGHPFAIYHSVGEERVDVECGFPVDKETTGHDMIMASVFEGTDCAMLEFTGDYSTLELGHDAIQEWMKVRSLELSGPPMEIYVVMGSDSEDPSQWVTKICYPFRR